MSEYHFDRICSQAQNMLREAHATGSVTKWAVYEAHKVTCPVCAGYRRQDKIEAEKLNARRWGSR